MEFCHNDKLHTFKRRCLILSRTKVRYSISAVRDRLVILSARLPVYPPLEGLWRAYGGSPAFGEFRMTWGSSRPGLPKADRVLEPLLKCAIPLALCAIALSSVEQRSLAMYQMVLWLLRDRLVIPRSVPRPWRDEG